MDRNVIHTDDGLGHPTIVKAEKMMIGGVRVLNRITYRDGTVKVLGQGWDGPWHRTQAEWDNLLSAHEFEMEN